MCGIVGMCGLSDGNTGFCIGKEDRNGQYNDSPEGYI